MKKVVVQDNFLRETAVETTKQKKKREKILSPRNMKACHSVSTALLKSVAEIGTQSVMKSKNAEKEHK
jgi:hypothetical protein